MALTKVTQTVIATGAISSSQIANGSITADHLTGVNTDHVSEGSTNLYFTNARADARIAAASTDDLTEGSNLYYTDARAQAVSINNVVEDTTPQLGGNLGANGNLITFGDSSNTGSNRLKFGASSDLQIYHTGTESWIKDAGSGNLYIDSNGAAIQLTSGGAAKSMINAVPDGGVTLFYNNDIKLNTSSAGATVTGTLTVTGDLDITGNVNSTSVTDLDVTDKTITLGAGQTEALSGGSGIIVDGSGASILWDETNTEWDFNSRINVPSTFSQYYSIRESGTQYGFIGQHKTLAGSGSDTSLTIFSETGDGINFAVNGSVTKAVVIDAEGDVGIGDTSPSFKLDVNNTSSRVRFKASSGDSTLEMSAIAGRDYAIQSLSDGRFRIYDEDANADRLIIDTNGEFNPTGVLYLGSGHLTAAPSDGVIAAAYADGYNNAGGDLELYGGRSTGDNAGGEIRFFTGAAGSPGTQVNSHTRRMTIDADGNVGIKETSPNAYLHVTGKTSYTTANSSEVSGLGFVRLQPNDNSEHSLWFHNAGNNLGISGYTDAATATSRDITLQTYGGSVGIGNTAPTALLHLGSSTMTINPVGIGIQNNTRYYALEVNSSALRIKDVSAGGIERVRLTAGGKLAVGDIATAGDPNRYLSVYSPSTQSSGFNDVVEFLAPSQTGGGVSVNFGVANSTKNVGKIVFNYSSSGSNANNIGLGFYDADNLMVIKADGNVGIGTSSPVANLAVRDMADGTHKGGRIGFGIHEAGSLQMYHSTNMSRTAGSTVTDSTSSGGDNVTLSSGQLYGPYITLPRGQYRLCVKMKTTNASYTGDAARITVYGPSGTVVTENRIIKGTDFDSNNKWETFSVPFQVVGATSGNIEYYAFALNSQQISFDYFFVMNDIDSHSTRIYGNQVIDGNVGIGTDSPSKTLSVKAPSGSNGGIDVFHNNGNKVAELVHHGSGDEGRLNLYDGGTSTVQLHGETGQDSYINSGDVGIGTSSPNHKLDVYSSERFPLRVHRTSSDLSDTQGVGIGLSIRGDTSTSTSDTRAAIMSKYNGDFYIAVDSGGNLNTTDPIDEAALFIEGANKYVGIGTTNPYSKLTVQGTSPSTYTGTGPGVTIRASQSTDGNWIASDVDGKFAYFGVDGNDGKFAAYNYATSTEMGMVLGQNRVRIDNTGRVGINRTPSIGNSKLEIGGADDVRLIVVEASGHTGGMGIKGGTGSDKGLKLFSGGAIKIQLSDQTNVAYTADGLFHSNARPSRYKTSGSGEMVLGYRDHGSGLYQGAMGLSYDNIDGLGNTAYRDAFVLKETSNGGQEHFRINGNGNVTNTNNSYGQISDERLKTDIVDASSQWEDIKAVRVRKFKFGTAPEGHDFLQIGVISQELEASGMGGLIEESDPDDSQLEFNPELVGERVKTVKYSVLYMKAIKALQEAMDRIEQLEARVTELEG